MKKFTSIILSVILVLSIFSVISITANATSKTAQEAVDWACAQIGNSIDGAYGCQCVDLIMKYYDILGVRRVSGNGCDYINNALPENGWYRTATPSVGDVVVWGVNVDIAREYGHVGIVVNVNGGYIDYVDQNSWEYGAKVGRHNGYLASKASTYIHPAFSGNPNPTPDFTPAYMGEDFYANIIHLDSGKAVAANGDNAGDNVTLQTLDGKLLHKWEFVHQGNNEYKIYNNHSGKCLDVRDVSSENGANIQVYDAHDTNAQLWYFKAVGNGYSLVPKCALKSAIDIKNGSAFDGANIQLWNSNDTSAQIFTLNYLPSFVAQNLGERFYANIVHQESNKPIVAIGDNDGDNVELGEFTGAIIKKWEFIRQNDWSYIIINNHSGKALDVNGGYTENMTNIQVYKSNNSNAQRWYIKEVGNGYSLVPKCALESALDLENGLAENGTNISLHKQNSSSAQIYYFNLQPSDIALDVGESFDAYIIHSASGFAVSYNAVGNTIIQPNENKDEQKWHFERQKDMSYIITNHIVDIDSDLYMSVDKQYNHDGANVQIDSANGLNGQRWYIIKNGSGYSLIPKCAVNKAMDLAGGNTDNGNIEIWGLEHDNPNQIFSITKVSTVEPTQPTTSTEQPTKSVTDKPAENTEPATVATETTIPVTVSTESTTDKPTEPTTSGNIPTEPSETADILTETTPTANAPTEPPTTESVIDKPTEPTQPTTDKPENTVVEKKANPVKVTAKTKTVKNKKLKSKNQTVKPLTVKNAKGTVKITKVKTKESKKIFSKITVNKKTGAITLKKGKYAKKTYSITLKINVKGNKDYKSKTITKTVKVKVK